MDIPENSAARITLQSTTKLNSRRKNICRFDNAGGAMGLFSAAIDGKITDSAITVELIEPAGRRNLWA